MPWFNQLNKWNKDCGVSKNLQDLESLRKTSTFQFLQIDFGNCLYCDPCRQCPGTETKNQISTPDNQGWIIAKPGILYLPG